MRPVAAPVPLPLDVSQRRETMLLRIEGITKHFSQEPVLAGVSAGVRRGAKIALVGPNGAGKSTLLRIMAGDEEADRGTVEKTDGVDIRYLRQQPDLEPDRTVWDEARSGLDHLYRLLGEAESLAADMARESGDRHDRLAERYDRIHEQLLAENAYHLDHRIERVLHGLGIPERHWRQRCGDLSGGQQRRLMLAKVLLSPADLLLLDEPTNHLDLEACQWLESYLKQLTCAVLLVSHDRYLLDTVAEETWELFQGTVECYTGNYTQYRRQKEERLVVERRTYERQQEEIARLEEFVRRHHYGQKHAQAEDRRKKLERIERVPPPRIIRSPAMKFPPPAHCGEIVLRVEKLGHHFGGPWLFEELSFDVERGEKWGILGANGTGKTTLLRCLTGELEPAAGRVIRGTGVQLAFFDQQLSGLDGDDPVLEAVRPDDRDFPEKDRRDLLARFGITGDQVFQRVGRLSGGERTRVALARLAAAEGNLLVLDEPTNQLDLWARSALEEALRSYTGTVVFVSHDRYFVNQVADRLLVFEADGVRCIHGNYDTYRMMAARETPATAEHEAAPTSSRQSPSGNRKGNKPARRKRRFPYRKVEDLEQEIAECESEIESWHARLADPSFHKDGENVREATAALEKLNARLEHLYEHWEEACELEGR